MTVLVGSDVIHFVDVVFLFVIGTVAIVFISKVISHYVGSYVGASQGNTVRLLFPSGQFRSSSGGCVLFGGRKLGQRSPWAPAFSASFWVSQLKPSWATSSQG